MKANLKSVRPFTASNGDRSMLFVFGFDFKACTEIEKNQLTAMDAAGAKGLKLESQEFSQFEVPANTELGDTIEFSISERKNGDLGIFLSSEASSASLLAEYKARKTAETTIIAKDSLESRRAAVIARLAALREKTEKILAEKPETEEPVAEAKGTKGKK